MKKGKIASALLALAFVLAQIPVSYASAYTNPILESVFFVDKVGNTILEPEGRDDVIPYVVVSKKEGAPTAGGTAAVATYDETGKLYSTQFIEINKSTSVYDELANLIERWTVSGQPMSYPQSGYAKAFWWDSASGMQPNTPVTDDILAPSSDYTGEVVLPDPFKTILSDVTITKLPGARNYAHNATPQSFYDWDSATTVYLSVNGLNSGLGETAATAITMPRFAQNFNGGSYGSQIDFVFVLTDDVYSGTTADALLVNNTGALSGGTNLKSSINALIKSGSPSGFTWLGEQMTNAAKTPAEGIYKATLSSAVSVIPVNLSVTDVYGMPKSYNLVATLAECKATKGTYYQEATTDEEEHVNFSDEVYVNLYDDENISDLEIYRLAPKFISGRYTGKLMFENIGFMPNALNDEYNRIMGGSYDNTQLGFFGCKFYRGAHNALGFQQKYVAYLFDCVNAYGARDGYNYHADYESINDKYSTAIEIGCISYQQGIFNKMYGSETDPNSNNASTGHDGMNILRVGGRYWKTEGPIVADGNCFTVNIGLEAYNFVTSSPSERSTFTAHNNNPEIRGNKLPNKYFIDCLGTGVKIRAGVVSSENSYVLDLKGNERTCLDNSGKPNPLKSITWDEIAAGGIKMYEAPEYKSSDAYLSEKQGKDGWSFQYASVGANDYTDYNEFDNGWFLDYQNNWAYGGVIAADTMHPGNAADVVKTFVCPKDGTVQITSDTTIAVNSSKSDGVNLKLLKNDEQVWPAVGWQLVQYGESPLTFAELTLKVKAGDKLYFRANCNINNSNDTVSWSPVVSYDTGAVDPEAPMLYKSSEAYPFQEQGKNGWNFQHTPLGSNAYTDYNVFDGGWFVDTQYNWAYGGVTTADTMHPGNIADAAKTFTCPRNGTIEVSADKIIKVTDSKSDGVNLKILRNDIQVWPASGWRFVGYGADFTFTKFTLEVEAGDKLHFRANCNVNNISDTVSWSPVVEYMEAAGKEVSSFVIVDVKTQYRAGDLIDRSVGKLIVTYADDTTGEVAFSSAGITVDGFDTDSTGTKTVTVSYRDKTATYDITVANAEVRDIYNVQADMSGIQGEKGWYYCYAPFGQYTVDSYVNLPYYNGSGAWSNTPDDTFLYGRIRMNQGDQDFVSGGGGDPSLIFKAPAPGTIKISMKNNIIKEIGTIDINRLRIYKNEEQIYPAVPGTWLTLQNGESVNFEELHISVSANDRIIFRNNKGIEGPNANGIKNDGDKMVFVPIIQYTEVD